MKSSSNTKGQVIRVRVPCNSLRNTSSTFGNMLMQLATLKFVVRQVACGVGNTGNKALQLAKRQCCATSCKVMLPYYLALRSTQKSSFKRVTLLVPFKTGLQHLHLLFVNYMTNQFKNRNLHRLCHTIGLKNSRHVFIQSEVE